jgi:uncharacterized protein (DUF2267 family)
MAATAIRGINRTVLETHVWLSEIETELHHPGPKAAYHALRGVLFALRDRLPVEAAVHLSAQLPMLIRGIYFEGYDPTGKPLKLHREEFLERVGEELRAEGGTRPEGATRAVLTVLARRLGEETMRHVQESWPNDLRSLWPAFPLPLQEASPPPDRAETLQPTTP